MDKTYTVQEAANILRITKRAVQGRANRRGLEKDADGSYLIPEAVLNRWKREVRTADPLYNTIEEVLEPEMITEAFTVSEYQELEKRLQEYPLQKQEIEQLKERIEDYRNQVRYLQDSLEKQREMQAKIIDTINNQAKSINASLQAIQQRNFIDAKEKGYDDQ